ncbi:MAG: anaerobic ribonucleoside-triphosphate reductase activating protein [Ruminococcaceae bacterium]|nr:anaerobic ribonucleoside-triphosphate reductase activating protein [Oscillospiraceae bacterium]
MEIAAIQKLTLLDYPRTIACILFTPGCNFCCPFCHNAGLVQPGAAENFLSESAVLDFLQKRQGILEGVVITGGEPLLHKDLPLLLEKIKNLNYVIKLDTNGSNPSLLKQVVSAGLVDYVAMDIKNAPNQYAKTAGLPAFDLIAVAQSKDYLMTDPVTYEFRTTVVKGLHTPSDMVALAQWISGARAYFLQAFKDSGNLLNRQGLAPFNETEMQALADEVRPYVPSVVIRGL